MKKFYRHLAARWPLSWLATFMASLLSTFLMALGPKFVRLFVDIATGRLGHSMPMGNSINWQFNISLVRKELLIISALFMFALILKFLFNLLEGLLSLDIKLSMEIYLQRLFKKYAVNHPSISTRELKDAIQNDIPQLATMLHSISLYVPILLANIILILIMIISENVRLGLATCFMAITAFSLGQRLSEKWSLIQSKISLKNQRTMDRMGLSNTFYLRMLLETKKIWQEEGILLISFFAFQMLPAVFLFVLAYFIGKEEGQSIGQITSSFLYFGLLHRPFNDLMQLYKNFLVTTSQLRDLQNSLCDFYVVEQALSASTAGLIFVNATGKIHGIFRQNDGPNIEIDPLSPAKTPTETPNQILADWTKLSYKRPVIFLAPADRRHLYPTHFLWDFNQLCLLPNVTLNFHHYESTPPIKS